MIRTQGEDTNRVPSFFVLSRDKRGQRATSGDKRRDCTVVKCTVARTVRRLNPFLVACLCKHESGTQRQKTGRKEGEPLPALRALSTQRRTQA